MRNKKSLQTRRHVDPVMPIVFRYRFLIMLCVLLVAAGAFCGSVSAYADVQTAQNLSDALNSTTDTGDGAAYADGTTVYLIRDVPLNFTINITTTDTITLTTESADYNISRNISGVPLFNVSSGTFILKGNESYNSNITLDGNKSTYTSSSGGYSLVKVNGGIFNMSTGSVLQNSNASTNYGAGVYLSGGTFNMTGGTISNNTATNGNGGGVYQNGGTFNMNGGTISGNNAPNGGAVDAHSGTFTMNGGNISNNTAATSGGGVFVLYGIFNMTGGTMSENHAASGGGVLVNPEGTFTMSGDSTLSGNTAKVDGGGVYVYKGTLTMSGGNISGNTADTDGGAVYQSDGTFNISGSAKVDVDNDVYMVYNATSNRFITVTGALDPSAGARNITPASTVVNGTPIVKYSSALPATWTNNFALNTTWANQYSFSLINSSNELLLITNCTVRFYNETDVVYDTQYAFSGSLITEPSPTPTKTGYTFSGWNNTTSGNNTLWSFSTDRVTVNPTNLSANWTENPTQVPTSNSNGDGGNDGNNADYGPVSLNGTFTTEDGNLTLYYPAGSNIMVTVFKDYFNGAEKPPGISYLVVYDVHSTADAGTSVTLVFRVNASLLEEMNLTSNDIAILHYYDGEWHQMTITSIELVDEVYQFTVTSTQASPFMIAYNVDGTWFPLEGATTPTSTPTTNPTETVPTSTTTPTPTEPTSSPVPLVGIIAGLGAAALLLRRRK